MWTDTSPRRRTSRRCLRAGWSTRDLRSRRRSRCRPAARSSVNVAPRYGIPEDAAAVSLNVTVTEPSSEGFITVFPCGTSKPTASTLNYAAKQSISNAVLAKVGSGGNVCIYAKASTHLLVDVAGWFPADTDFTSLKPERLLDTRSGIGHKPAGIVPANTFVELKVTEVGTSDIPAGAGAVVLNVTATDAKSNGFVTVYPCSEDASDSQQPQLHQGSPHRQRSYLESRCRWEGLPVHQRVDASGRRCDWMVPDRLRMTVLGKECCFTSPTASGASVWTAIWMAVRTGRHRCRCAIGIGRTSARRPIVQSRSGGTNEASLDRSAEVCPRTTRGRRLLRHLIVPDAYAAGRVVEDRGRQSEAGARRIRLFRVTAELGGDGRETNQVRASSWREPCSSRRLARCIEQRHGFSPPPARR